MKRKRSLLPGPPPRLCDMQRLASLTLLPAPPPSPPHPGTSPSVPLSFFPATSSDHRHSVIVNQAPAGHSGCLRHSWEFKTCMVLLSKTLYSTCSCVFCTCYTFCFMYEFRLLSPRGDLSVWLWALPTPFFLVHSYPQWPWIRGASRPCLRMSREPLSATNTTGHLVGMARAFPGFQCAHCVVALCHSHCLLRVTLAEN